jgi:protocatechuate 3,4-dioxygenase beta subunit
MESGKKGESRRDFLRMLAAVPIVLGAPSLLIRDTHVLKAPSLLTPTPMCGDDDDDDPTPAQTEGPYFKPRSPERKSLVSTSFAGTALVLTGGVYTRSCKPVEGALLDFWQCDEKGVYDNSGFDLRGHQFAGADGAFRLETMHPGLYTGRTRHIHVKVQAPNRPVLTTQLYFPNEPQNSRDGIFHQDLVMRVAGADRRLEGRFNFVLDIP